MSDDARHHSGIVLARESAGERHLRLTLLDPEHGLVRCLYKPAAKSGAATVTPDLFDIAEVFLDAPRGDGPARFVREYRLVRRHAALGADYARLTLACRLANLLSKNPHPPESWPAIHALASRAFAAIADRPHPETAYFKCLWLLARDEGLPVKEDFFVRLRPGERDLAVLLLNTPLAGITGKAAPKPLVTGLVSSLEQWLVSEAHFVI